MQVVQGEAPSDEAWDGEGSGAVRGRTTSSQIRTICWELSLGRALILAARGETPAAFDGRGILGGGVAPRSNTPGILGRRALPARRLARLGATPGFHHGLSVKLRLKPTSNRVEQAALRGLRRSFTDDVGPDAVIGVLSRSTIIDLPAKEDLMTPNIETIIKDHVTLTVRCLDRIYLQGYMPKLQTSGGLCYFLRDHLGHPIPSPALFRPMHDRFVAAIKTCAADHAVPLIEFESGQDKDAIVATHRARFRGEDGVVVIGVAQEKARAFKAHKRTGPQGGVTFDFTRQSVAVNHYYFYVQDREWGPAFVKIGTYLPYPIKLCLNGHEWVKQQLRRAADPVHQSRQRLPLVRRSERVCKRSVTSSVPATCSSSSTAGPTACPGRCAPPTGPPASIIASRSANSKSV